MITLSMIIALLVICNIIFIYRFIKLKKGLKKYQQIGTGRFGFYKYSHSSYLQYNSYIYVNEIDRYSGGFSKVEINRIEPLNSNYIGKSIEYSRDSFLTLMATQDITWLENEDHLKKLRKEKLESLKKI